MRRFALPQVQAFIAFVHPGLRKTQAGNLCLVIYGLLCCRTPSLSGVARCIPGARRLIHRIKRVEMKRDLVITPAALSSSQTRAMEPRAMKSSKIRRTMRASS